MFLTAHASAQQQGGRSHQCDATAVTAAPGGVVAFAVLDGIGSSDEVARFTRNAAHRLTRAAVRLGSAEAAVRQVSYEIDADPARLDLDEPPAACALVALLVPGEPLQLAWSGDVRAYAIRDDATEQLTRDHNWRRVLQDKGRPVGEGDRNTVTSCLGGANSAHEIEQVCGHPAVETATVDREELRLVLVTDGAYEPIEDFGTPLHTVLTGFPAGAAEDFAETAVSSARMFRLPHQVDNATVRIVDLVP